MRVYHGNYLGMVINSSDPEYRGRVQVFIPHVMPALYEGWNKEGADIQISCVGSNIPEGLTPEIHARLVKILPWAESASPIIGGSAPGNLFSDIAAGVEKAVGAVAGAVAGAVNNFIQSPTSAPITAGTSGNSIADAALSLHGTSTANIPGYNTDGGNLGCAAAVSLMFKKGTGQDILPGKSIVTSTDELYSGLSNNKNYVKVPIEQIQPGDILVTARGSRPGHTGIYTGDGKITSNSSSGFQGSAKGTIQPNYNIESWKNGVISRNPSESAIFRYVGPTNINGNTTNVAAGGAETTASSVEQASPNPLTTPNPTSEFLNTPKVPEQGAIQPTEGIGMTGTISGGGTASSGNTQVRNFSGNNSQAYATAKAAAIAAGSPDPDTTASIAMLESGHLSSSMSKRANNPFGQTITKSQAATLASGGNIGHGIIGSTVGADGQPHAVYDSLESAMSHHVEKWGSKYVAGNPGASVNNMVAAGYNTESIDGLPPGQYWKNGVLNRYNKLSGQTAQPTEGLAGEPPSASQSTTSSTFGSATVVNNTDSYGRTPVMNTNDMANGLFAYPNPGAMVWVFFREGNPLFPVYFAASYSSAEWSSAYRGGSPATGYYNDGKKISKGTNMKFGPEGGIWTKFESNLEDTTGIEEKASMTLYHKGGSNITFDNGFDFYHSHFSKRDEVEQDRFAITKGYKEEWVEGDSSSNVRGNLIFKIGKFDEESMKALQELAKQSAETNAALTKSS